jgi:hypothetical protein
VAEQLSGHARQQHAKLALLKLPVLILVPRKAPLINEARASAASISLHWPRTSAPESASPADQAALYRDGRNPPTKAALTRISGT